MSTQQKEDLINKQIAPKTPDEELMLGVLADLYDKTKALVTALLREKSTSLTFWNDNDAALYKAVDSLGKGYKNHITIINEHTHERWGTTDLESFVEQHKSAKDYLEDNRKTLDTILISGIPASERIQKVLDNFRIGIIGEAEYIKILERTPTKDRSIDPLIMLQ